MIHCYSEFRAYALIRQYCLMSAMIFLKRKLQYNSATASPIFCVYYGSIFGVRRQQSQSYCVLSDECESTKLGVRVNHVLVSLASPFYDLALHLCILSTI